MLGIYKILSPSGKVYIGQSKNIYNRFLRYHKLDCKSQGKLYNSLKKYTPNQHLFEIVCLLPIDVSQDILNKYEDIYLKSYKQFYEVLNIRDAGSNGKMSEETKIKIGLANKHLMTDDKRQKISLLHKGKKLSIQSIEKMKRTKLLTKKPISEETRKKISKSNKGRIVSKETVEKVQATRNQRGIKVCDLFLEKGIATQFTKGGTPWNKGKEMDSETRKKVKEARTKQDMSNRRKKIICIETGELFLGVSEAAKAIGIKESALGYRLRHGCKKKPTLIYHTASL